MINVLDLLYICLSIAALVFAGFFAYLVVQIVKTAKTIRHTIQNIEDTTDNVKENITTISEGLKYGVLGLITKLIGTKGGENYDTK
jgi:hypothetical protein